MACCGVAVAPRNRTRPPSAQPMAWGEFRELRRRFWKRRMEETLRPVQRHRYVGKGGDSQERRRKEAGGRGGGGQHTRRQADSGGGELNAPFLQGPWPWGCLLFCQACLPPYLGVTVSRQLFSMKAEGRASPRLPAFQLAENFHLGMEAGGRGWGWEIHQETKKGAPHPQKRDRKSERQREVVRGWE